MVHKGFSLQTLSILVVDDSLVMRNQIRKELEKLGHSVIDIATNGKEAIEKYETHKPDVVTMDITMPEMDGIEAAGIIKENHPSAKIIMVTSHDQQGLVKKALELGAMGYVLKPIEPDTLRENLEMVARLLR